MLRPFAVGCALSALALVIACSSAEPSEPAAPVATAGGGAAALPSTGGGGSVDAGATSGGSPSVAGSVTGGAGQAATAGSGGNGGGASGAGGAATLPTGPFDCSMYIGAYLSMEWYGAGFEQIVDNAKWQLKWHHHGYISTWENADSVFWSDEGDPNDDAKGSPIQSKCAAGSDKPDRIVFLAIDWELDSEDEWVASLSKVVSNVKTKYPSVKLLEFMTLVRCPSNQMCNDDATYGEPGTNLVAAQQDCWVPDYQDAAIAKVAALNPGFVGVGPKPQMMDCPNDGAHMSPAGNTQAAKDLGAYYLARP